MKILKLTPYLLLLIMFSCGNKKTESQTENVGSELAEQKEVIQTLEGITKEAVNIKTGIGESLNSIDELLNEF